MDSIINPIIFYAACALGAVGVCMALPRGKRSVQIFGAIFASAAGGLVLLGMGLKSPSHLPNVYFYVFSLISLGGALRVVTHPRPVYAALYFILTIISSAGLFLILSAEFMAFALVIVYAGAILITYLFVIMLATQAPTDEGVELLAEYDTASREPVAATVCGFVMLAALSTMLFSGASAIKPVGTASSDSALLVFMPKKVENSLRDHGLLKADESLAKADVGDGYAISPLGEGPWVKVKDSTGAVRTISGSEWPADLKVKNVEALGFTLLRDHPGSIEIAGVILLMAMLGAVVLSRKQVQIDEDAKMRHAQRLADPDADSPELRNVAGGAR